MIIPAMWVSIDPGDRFVGYCLWQGVKCVRSYELGPEQAIGMLEDDTEMRNVLHYGLPQGANDRRVSLVVYERFALYAWNQKSMAGNEFKTSQMIGTIKYICRRAEVEIVGQFASQGKSTYNRAPFKHWKARDWQRVLNGPIGRGHTRDAAAHGFEFMRTRGYVPA